MNTVATVPMTRAPSRSPSAIIVRKLFRRKLVLAGAAIIVGMLISGDRIASLLGRLLRPRAGPTRIATGVEQDTG